MKLRPVIDAGLVVGYSFKCPGCGWSHCYMTVGDYVWGFNGDLDKPTFTPSLKNSGGACGDDHICHLNVTDGQIIFHADCTHAYKDKVIDLLDY